jgi:hypothetical protein
VESQEVESEMRAYAALFICTLFPNQGASHAGEPQVLHFQVPQYPALAWQTRISGRVSLNILVYKDGTVGFADETEGHPLLVAAAKDNLKTWTFERNDSMQAIPLRIEFEYRFDETRETYQLVSDVTFDLPRHVTVLASTPAITCRYTTTIKSRHWWQFWKR